MRPEDYAIRDQPFVEVEAKVFVGENIAQGLMVALHPQDGMLYAVWRGAAVAGIAIEPLEQGKVATFNPHVGHFRVDAPATPKCETCKDGTNLEVANADFECPACGQDLMPF